MTALEFWRWFSGRESELFESGEAALVQQSLSRVNEALRATITPVTEGKRALEIRPPKEAEASADELIRSAPQLERWVIRKAEAADRSDLVSFDGLTLQKSEVQFVIKDEGAKAGIVLYMPGYSEAEYSRYLTIAFRLLDDELSEAVVESDLGTISMEAPRKSSSGLSLALLPQALKDFKDKLQN